MPKILTDELAEDACARSVEYAYAGHADKNGVVDEIGDGRDGFVAAHAADIEVLLEVEFAVVYCLAGLASH